MSEMDDRSRNPVISTLRKRPEFLAAARAARRARPGFVLQARRRSPDEGAEEIRIGYTCSKKVGNAVARNRAKRRLRAAARAVAPSHGRAGWDYVVIGRRDATASLPFETLCRDFASAMDELHRKEHPA